jgi:glycosyltransferase involved in cell wall biosynthesis
VKLYYITRVNIPSQSAQSIQITAMCKAFFRQKIDFRFISPENTMNIYLEDEFDWERIKLITKFKHLEFAFKSFIKAFKEKPSHVYTRDIVIAYLVSFLNIKVIYESHKEPMSKTASLLMTFLATKNNFFLVTISKALKDFYVENYSFKDDKLLSCHDGVFLDKYNKLKGTPKKQLRRELNLPIDKVIVMHTGSMYKGNDAMLFESVIDNFKDILFVQVGGSEGDLKKYKEYYKLFNNIIFIPHQSNDILVRYQMSADLLFYALTKENALWWCTSPLKIFEYMATGITIIASNIGSISEILNDTNSISFSPDESKSIVIGINYFLNNRSLAIKKSQQAFNDVKFNFTWERRAIKILSFIK